MVQLAKLDHLTELRLDRTIFNLDALEEALLVPLPSVRVLSLPRFHLNGSNDKRIGVNFCRIFSKLFPNLEELYVEFDDTEEDVMFVSDSYLDYDYATVICYYCTPFHPKYGVKPHLGMFSKLRKHEISAYYEDDDDW